MDKRERRGAIWLVTVLLLMIALPLTVKQCDPAKRSVEKIEIVTIKNSNRTDTATTARQGDTNKKHNTTPVNEKKRAKASDSKPKQASQPAPVRDLLSEPVAN